MGVLGLFVALTQVDFMLVRIAADMVINHVTTYYFLNGKTVRKLSSKTSTDCKNDKNASEFVECATEDSSTEMCKLVKK